MRYRGLPLFEYLGKPQKGDLKAKCSSNKHFDVTNTVQVPELDLNLHCGLAVADPYSLLLRTRKAFGLAINKRGIFDYLSMSSSNSNRPLCTVASRPMLPALILASRTIYDPAIPSTLFTQCTQRDQHQRTCSSSRRSKSGTEHRMGCKLQGTSLPQA